jgi:uncharacterized membrane-anchored protein
MKRAGWPLATLLASIAVQLAVPSSMIIGRERVLKHGRLFKFRTAPVDPYDAIRGRYVALRFNTGAVPVPEGSELRYGQNFYVTLTTAADGYAMLADASMTPPDRGSDYLRVRAGYASSTEVTPELPFDRFYMGEKLAPAAEAAYRVHSQRDHGDAYVTVRVADGVGVIENLFIAGRPIDDVVRAR